MLSVMEAKGCACCIKACHASFCSRLALPLG
ncbi:Uncharacterised protein [Vibrio cholerae]|nr:Uncharacterised protein [Vibrio cholerae]